jgi:PD-(D/E)XK nuclease superfamily
MSDWEMQGRVSTLLAQASEVFAEEQRGWKATAQRFNVFDSISFIDYELRHSEFISFLLDPHAAHDQGTDFLKAFLSHIKIEDIEDLSHARVVTELAIPNRRLDIFVHIPGILALAIENKIWSEEGDDQVGVYQDWLSKNHAECKVTRLVFLTANGQQPKKPREGPPIEAISYAGIRRWLKPFTGLGGTLGSTITMYRKVCSRFNGGTMENRQNSKSVSALLTSGINFDTAWAIAESLEVEKSQLLREYWSAVTAVVNEQLREFPSPIKWEARIAQYRNKRGNDWLAIVPKHCKSVDTDQGWDPVAFTIMVEKIYTANEKDAYFGIRGINAVTKWSLHIKELAAPLIRKLGEIDFETEDDWFLALKYFRHQQQHAFFGLESKKSMLTLVEERALHYPTAKWLANTLVELFRQSQPILDELNAVAAG